MDVNKVRYMRYLFLLFVASVCLPVNAAVFKCKLADGTMAYSDIPCAASAEVVNTSTTASRTQNDGLRAAELAKLEEIQQKREARARAKAKAYEDEQEALAEIEQTTDRSHCGRHVRAARAIQRELSRAHTQARTRQLKEDFSKSFSKAVKACY